MVPGKLFIKEEKKVPGKKLKPKDSMMKSLLKLQACPWKKLPHCNSEYNL
jgi:hypothetical protein